jgi:hypothetical protein
MEQSINDAVTDDITPAEILPTNTVSTPPAAGGFTKVDKNLTGIGFFTASSKRSRKAIEKTTVVIDQGIEHRISILPSAKYGLPITFDQDCWLALMELVSERVKRDGKPLSKNEPFVFSTADLLHILGRTDAGKNYKAVQEWLSVMKHTGIEGGAYNTAKKKWVKDRVSTLDRVLTVGEQLDNGTIADKNYIWFSQWQIDNINDGKLLLIEMSGYQQLQSNIAKNLVPHLQEWLFTSEHQGKFEKQYDDVCQLLGVRVYSYPSKIQEKFGPALDDLKANGYLSDWAIELMADKKHYKLVLWHGPKYHHDRQTRLEKRSRLESPPTKFRRPRQAHLNLLPTSEPQSDVRINHYLDDRVNTLSLAAVDSQQVKRMGLLHINAADAAALLSSLPVEEREDYLEYFESQVHRPGSTVKDPGAWVAGFIRKRKPLPAAFETSRQRKARQEAEFAKAEAVRREHQASIEQEEAETKNLTLKFEALPEPARLALLEQVKAEQPSQMAHWLKTNPEASSFLMARARMKLKDGWIWQEPHYATNPTTRQATPLQESATDKPSQNETILAQEKRGDFATVLQTILTTPQLPAPVEQGSVKPAPVQTSPAKTDPVW